MMAPAHSIRGRKLLRGRHERRQRERKAEQAPQPWRAKGRRQPQSAGCNIRAF